RDLSRNRSAIVQSSPVRTRDPGPVVPFPPYVQFERVLRSTDRFQPVVRFVPSNTPPWNQRTDPPTGGPRRHSLRASLEFGAEGAERRPFHRLRGPYCPG